MGRRIHQLIRQLTGQRDPYRKPKQLFNAIARDTYPTLARYVRSAADPMAAAVRLAIAGNIIDLGCVSHLTAAHINHAVREAMDDSLEGMPLEELTQGIARARRILYLADNAGELFFDRLLIEQIPPEKVILAVRGQPVINDATREDAEIAGLTNLVSVIDNGSDVPGTVLRDCSPAFRETFEQADLIISKGQGNYETLSEAKQNLFFLLKAKCPVVARDIGRDVGRIVISRSRRSAQEANAQGAQASRRSSHVEKAGCCET
ncbi:MAG: hypothetical protein AMXMBFR13_48650 [Phycisphaerae bacterium]